MKYAINKESDDLVWGIIKLARIVSTHTDYDMSVDYAGAVDWVTIRIFDFEVDDWLFYARVNYSDSDTLRVVLRGIHLIHDASGILVEIDSELQEKFS